MPRLVPISLPAILPGVFRKKTETVSSLAMRLRQQPAYWVEPGSSSTTYGTLTDLLKSPQTGPMLLSLVRQGLASGLEPQDSVALAVAILSQTSTSPKPPSMTIQSVSEMEPSPRPKLEKSQLKVRATGVAIGSTALLRLPEMVADLNSSSILGPGLGPAPLNYLETVCEPSLLVSEKSGKSKVSSLWAFLSSSWRGVEKE